MSGAPVNVCPDPWADLDSWLYELLLSQVPSDFPELRAVLEEVPQTKTDLDRLQLGQVLTPTEIAIASALMDQMLTSITQAVCGRELLPA